MQRTRRPGSKTPDGGRCVRDGSPDAAAPGAQELDARFRDEALANGELTATVASPGPDGTCTGISDVVRAPLSREDEITLRER